MRRGKNQAHRGKMGARFDFVCSKIRISAENKSSATLANKYYYVHSLLVAFAMSKPCSHLIYCEKKTKMLRSFHSKTAVLSGASNSILLVIPRYIACCGRARNSPINRQSHKGALFQLPAACMEKGLPPSRSSRRRRLFVASPPLYYILLVLPKESGTKARRDTHYWCNHSKG